MPIATAPVVHDRAHTEPADVDIRYLKSINDISAANWDACTHGHPLSRHAYFAALEASGTAGATSGIAPAYVVVHDRLVGIVAVAAAMLKSNGLGEFGPERGWIQPAQAAGLCGPQRVIVGAAFTPVQGPRLLIRPGEPVELRRAQVLQGLDHVARTCIGAPGWTIAWASDEEAAWLRTGGYRISYELQAYWATQGHANLAAWWRTLHHHARNVMTSERCKVRASGLHFAVIPGCEVTQATWDAFYLGYRRVCQRYGGKAWYPPSYFSLVAKALPDEMWLLAAFEGERFVAGTVCIRDASGLHARTWSCTQDRPGLVFELACYWPMDLACAWNLTHVWSNSMLPYKKLRGFATRPVPSVHWLVDPRMRAQATRLIAADCEGLGL